MTDEQFHRKLGEVVGSGLKKYAWHVRSERELYWRQAMQDHASAVSDPLESDEDRQFQRLADLYAQANDAQRESIRALCRGSLSVILFADRMATKSLRTGSQQSLQFALIALAMEEIAFDFRDSMGAMTTIRTAAERYQLDVNGAVMTACQLSTPATAEFFQEFMQRPLQGLAHSMGLIETFDENGPILRSSQA